MTSLADDIRRALRTELTLDVRGTLLLAAAVFDGLTAENDRHAADLARVTAERDALRAELAAIEPDAFEDDPDGYDEALS